MSETNTEVLGDSPLGADLDAGECKALSGIMRHRKLADGEVLYQEGERGETLYVITSGQLAVTRDVGGGDHVTLHILRHGDLAGEMAFVDGRPHSATLRALGDTTVYELDRSGFESLLDSNPRLVYKVMRAIIRVVHDTLLRMNQQYVEMTNYITKTHGRY